VGCQCKGTKKGIANYENNSGVIREVTRTFNEEVGNLSYEALSPHQQEVTTKLYYDVYPNSKPVTSKQAYDKLTRILK